MSKNEVAVRVGGLTVGALVGVAEGRHVVTAEGEVLDVSVADDQELVTWSLIAQRLRLLARNIEETVHGELAVRCRATGGAIQTPLGTATETISRGSVSGIAAAQIRAVLEDAAEDGVIPWDAVDNIAPLVPHVTPAKVANYVETCPTELAEVLEKHMPQKRRTIKVAEQNV